MNMVDRPKRLQRKRSDYWSCHPGAVYVGRPTKWGNPYRVVPCKCQPHCGHFLTVWWDSIRGEQRALAPCETYGYAVARAIDQYRNDLLSGGLRGTVTMGERELAGKDLICWCKLDAPCHADVLLEVFNA